MTIITAKGESIKDSLIRQTQAINLDKVFIHLKDGESLKVRLLSSADYVEYMAHGLYKRGIYTQPCIKPAGESCAYCEAAKAGIKEFKALRAYPRYLFAMADMQVGAVRVFDATRRQAVQLMDTIADYTEYLGEVVFQLKRTGSSLDTKYFLNPIIKPGPEDLKAFKQFDGHTIDDSFYDEVVPPKTREEQIKELQKAGFRLTS